MSTTTATQLPTGTWSIDPVHSSIGFGVKHLGVSTFRGTFKGAAGTITTEEPALTGHLHSEDFFDAANHPELTFKSTSVEQADDGHLRVAGDLTLRGVTRPVEL